VNVQPLVSNLSEARTVHVEPVSSSDWEVIQLNAGLVEHVLCTQVRVVWVGLVLPLWLGSTRADLVVTAIDPSTHGQASASPPSSHSDGARDHRAGRRNHSCWLVPLDGEIVVAPKERARATDNTDDADDEDGACTDMLPPGVAVDVSLRIVADPSVRHSPLVTTRLPLLYRSSICSPSSPRACLCVEAAPACLLVLTDRSSRSRLIDPCHAYPRLILTR
jgi:hypothetical protein